MNRIAYKTSDIPSAALGETQDSDTADMTLALHPSVDHIMKVDIVYRGTE